MKICIKKNGNYIGYQNLGHKIDVYEKFEYVHPLKPGTDLKNEN